MKKVFSFVILVVTLFGIHAIVYGATNEFTIRTLVGSDTTPPSTPSGLTATPTATTQINLAWATSTDNVALSGYQVFRDGTQIATTSAISYADVGLTPSTTYAYYVTAFDSSNNISASSSIVSTTTLSLQDSVSETTTSTSYGTRVSNDLVRLEVLPERDAVVIRYETQGNTRTKIGWGRTVSYEIGTLAERSFLKQHETRIIGLSPGTTYKFIIRGENAFGTEKVLTESFFTTLPPKDVRAPANVQGLQAVVVGDDIVLSWTNPKDADFAKVRVVRSDLFYPVDSVDGWVLYENDGESVRDRGQAVPGTRKYYAVFSYDALGNISSGAVVSVIIPHDSSTGPIPTTTTPSEEIPNQNELGFTFDELIFTQENTELYVENGAVYVSGAKNLTISIPYERMPRHLKTILVTLADSENNEKEFSFLLRANAEKTAYTGTLAPLGIAGSFPVRVHIFDFKTAHIGMTEGTIESRIMHNKEIEETSLKAHFFESALTLLFKIVMSPVFWLLLFFAFLILVIKKRASTNSSDV